MAVSATPATSGRRSRRGSRASNEHGHHHNVQQQQQAAQQRAATSGRDGLRLWCRLCGRIEERLGVGRSRWVLAGAAAVASGLVTLLFALVDVVCAYAQLCSVPVPFIALMSGYLALALALRRSWTPTGIYITFCGSVAGELVGFFITSALVSGAAHRQVQRTASLSFTSEPTACPDRSRP